MKMSYVSLTCIAIFSFGLYTSWKHIMEWLVVIPRSQFHLEIARVNMITQIHLRLSQGAPFFSTPEMVLQFGPWTPPRLQLGFNLLQFRCQREDRPFPNCLCECLCSIWIYLTNVWYNLQIGRKLQVRKKWCSDKCPLSKLSPYTLIIVSKITVTRPTTIRYIISLHDDAKCNIELPAPTGTTVFHFALTSRAIFRFAHLSTLRLWFPWRGCWHLGEGLNLKPNCTRCSGHTWKSWPPESPNKPTWAKISSFSDKTHVWDILTSFKCSFLLSIHEVRGTSYCRPGQREEKSHWVLQ